MKAGMKNQIMLFIVFVCSTFQVMAQNDTMKDLVYKSQIMAKIAELEMDDILTLWFTDADTGSPIEGMTVAIQNSGSVKTDADGLAMFPVVDDGEHSFITQKEGYVMIRDTFTVFEGVMFFNKYSIPKIMPANRIKIVLDWGDSPSDLDAHLVKDNAYHISYRDSATSADRTAWLDRDEMNGYGPETITVTEVDNNALYHFFIHNYSNRDAVNNSRLSQSKAVVRVYVNNRLNMRYQIEPGKTGTIWNVFDIRRGQIQPVNRYE
ncbi:hypothetical protein AGMMS4952_24890 [Spirochaetia bacterium]|nr:hypothetical protein AGMMS4952_24890 [Spirochaetia bacterium]